MRSGLSFASIAVLVCSFGVAASARADDAGAPRESTAERAKAAYDRGVEASARKDYAEAVRDFAEADALAPNAVALEAALEVAMLADDPVLGSELLERAKRDPTLNATTVAAARDKFARRTGLIAIHCDACTSTVDGKPAGKSPIRVLIGKHVVKLVQGERPFETQAEVRPDETTTVDMPPAPKNATTPPPKVETPKAPAENGPIISPGWAIGGAVVTAGALAGMIASAVDTVNLHDEFAVAAEPEKHALGVSGRAAQTRTNVLVGVSAGCGAATLALSLLAVRWHSDDEKATSALRFSPGGLSFETEF